MSVWKEKRLGELVSINPQQISSKLKNGKIQYVDISSVCRGMLSGYTEYDISQAPSRARRIIQNHDIIYSTVRPNLRAYYYVKNAPSNAVCSTGFAVLRARESSCSRFIYYLVSGKNFVDHLSLVAKGSAYPAVDTKDFEKAKILVPDLPTQNRIADILSTYDDLIENNNRRITLLEQAAQELYKEWFVRFRFPGYENTKFENGLPCGWEVVRLGDYVDIKGGKRLPPGKILCEQPTAHPYIRIRDLCDSKFVSLTNAFEYIDDSTYDIIRRFTVETGDILISIVGTIGALCCVGKSLNGANLTENCVKLVSPKTLTQNYIYHFLHSEAGKAAINTGIVGATQPKLPLYNIKRIKLVKPDEAILSKFESYLQPVNCELMTLQDSNLRLARQRDLLLPRLISGHWEV